MSSLTSLPQESSENTSDNACEAESEEYTVQELRYRQALRIGYLEMERIVEEIIVSEFTRIGEVLLSYGYEVEVVMFDTESEINDTMYVCGAGLRISSGYMKNAIVYTGDPHSFRFVLQTQNFANKTTEEHVQYHRLTPNWFHRRVKSFIADTFWKVDISKIENFITDDWDMLEGPFSVKIKNTHGYYNEIAQVDTIEAAFQLGSHASQGYCSAEDLLLVDSNGKEFC